jgi:hypothetical protein
MEKRMDASNISVNELAKKFVDYINSTPDEQLKESYINDVYENEDDDKCIGKFRLLHLFDSTQNNEYLTFTACFFTDETGIPKLTIHNIEKGTLILECTYDASKPSWIAEQNIPDLYLSSITGMATKLRKILI